jgi:sigma-B regulation protein RsbU (phosphoserine phosphatase)
MSVNETTIETLIDAVRKASSSLDLDEVLESIFDSISELIEYSAAVVGLIDSKTGAVQALKARGYPPENTGEEFLEPGLGIIGWVIANRRGQIVNDVKKDSRYVKARPQTRSEIAAPIIRVDGEVIGAINLEADWEQGFDEPDLKLLTMFASLAASAIDHTLLYQKVGGDYFDFFDSITDRLGVIISDVSGKGLAAALIMVTFRAYMQATIINEFAMRVVMARVNKLIHKSTDGERFITTFYGLIDPENKRLLYIIAGHNPPLLLRADGTSRQLEHSGLPLGIFEDSRYSESVVDFQSGDILVLYTDGVTEARNAADKSFGVEKLEQTVRKTSLMAARAICEAVAEAVREHSAEVGGPEDDLTISIIKVK